jgi:hypothetical protein
LLGTCHTKLLTMDHGCANILVENEPP